MIVAWKYRISRSEIEKWRKSPPLIENFHQWKRNKKNKKLLLLARTVIIPGMVDSSTRAYTRARKRGEGAHVNAAAAVNYEWSSLDLSFSLIVSYALHRYPLSTELYNNLMPDIISYLLSGRLPALPYSFLYESWKAAAEQMER